ncbi:exonuclease domain-containing protein [Corynebacterium propinquum]
MLVSFRSAISAISGGLWGQKTFDIAAPADDTALDELPILAVDMETTGIKPARDAMLSIGWVPLNGRSIDLSGAGYVVVAGAEVGESATIHGLTDDEVATGVSPEEAIEQLLQALRGRVLLAHFAALETGFVHKYCRQLYDGAVPDLAVVDTFSLERRHMERMATYPRGEDLRLPRVRERYHLPYYTSHNALNDALACAEAYLAITSASSVRTLKDIKE